MVKLVGFIYRRIPQHMKTQQPIKFTKMHGLGNDFIVINALYKSIYLEPLTIQKLSRRYTGIGFDQLLLLEPSEQVGFACRFFNSDGSEAEQCGNGIRCAARYIHENGLIDATEFAIETKAGIVNINIHDYNKIEVSLGVPYFEADKQLTLEGHSDVYKMSVLSMGNPHAILTVESLESFPITDIGKQIATHHSFPKGSNVGFMQIINSKHFLLRTYERGVGETLACGSNACAAAVSGMMKQVLLNTVTVELELGTLQIEWQGVGYPVIMTGSAERVFEGEFII